MSYATIGVRTGTDSNSFTDFNQLNDNVEAVIDGTKPITGGGGSTGYDPILTDGGVAQANRTIKFPLPFNVKFNQVTVKMDVAPMGADVKIDYQVNGSSIMNNSLTVLTNATFGTSSDFSSTTANQYDIFSIVYNTVGSATAGGDSTYHIEDMSQT